MKKVILSLAIVAIATLGANAQVKFGVKAGLNIANITGDVSGLSSITSFNAGGTVNIPIASEFSVQPELLYSGEGAKEGSGKYHLNYINVPVMLQYHNSGFVGELGPQIGFLASAKAKSGGTSVDVKDQFKSTAFALAFGVGYQLQQGIGFGVRYNLGLSNIVDNSGSDKAHSSVFSVGASYTFKSKK